MTELPPAVAALAAQLADLPGAVAVVLGGSRASGTAREDSDWDLGVYYRAAAPLDPGEVRALGHDGFVSELGEWGPVVNGGAWLTLAGLPVDVLFRDLDRIERWCADAERGEFDVLLQNGHRAGAPTYLPMGELGARGEWALTEKGLAERAGLGATQDVFAALTDLPAAVEAVGEQIGIEPLQSR